MTPEISIIIPTYNRADFVVQTVESVLKQSFSNYEIIVVNDGSTDNTDEVLAPYLSLPNFRYFSQENSGRSTARNLGIKNSRGEWLLFLDSDDMLFEDALSFLSNKRREYPEVKMIGGTYVKIDENDNLLTQTNFIIKHGKTEQLVNDPYLSLINNYYLPMGSYIVHRDVVNADGKFESNLEPCEDFDFCLRIARESKLAYFKTPIVKFRKHGGNTAENSFYVTNIKIAHKHLNETINDTSVKDKSLIISEWKNYIANNFFNQNEFKNALRNYLSAVYYNPKNTLDKRFYKQVLSCLVPKSVKQLLKKFM